MWDAIDFAPDSLRVGQQNEDTFHTEIVAHISSSEVSLTIAFDERWWSHVLGVQG
jgi:hypothetical protein